jgi:hypothetical protein
MASAASTAKGGFVRDALVGSFPRLATLLEDALSKLQRDTNVSLLGLKQSVCCCWIGARLQCQGFGTRADDSHHSWKICDAVEWHTRTCMMEAA